MPAAEKAAHWGNIGLGIASMGLAAAASPNIAQAHEQILARNSPAFEQYLSESPGNPHIGGVTSNHALSAQQQWLRQQAEQAGLSFRTQSLSQMAANRPLPTPDPAPYSDFSTNHLDISQNPQAQLFAQKLSSGTLDPQLGFENRMSVARTLDPAMAPPDPTDEFSPPISSGHDPRTPFTRVRDSWAPGTLEFGDAFDSWRTDTGELAPTTDFFPLYSQSHDIKKGGWQGEALTARGTRPKLAFTPKPANTGGSRYIDAAFADADALTAGKKLLYLDEPLRPEVEADLLSRLQKSSTSLTRAGNSRPIFDILTRNGIRDKDRDAAIGALRSGTFPSGLPSRASIDLLDAIWPNKQVGTRFVRDVHGYHGGSGNARGYLLPQVPGAPKTQGLSNRKYHRLFDPPIPQPAEVSGQPKRPFDMTGQPNAGGAVFRAPKTGIKLDLSTWDQRGIDPERTGNFIDSHPDYFDDIYRSFDRPVNEDALHQHLTSGGALADNLDKHMIERTNNTTAAHVRRLDLASSLVSGAAAARGVQRTIKPDIKSYNSYHGMGGDGGFFNFPTPLAPAGRIGIGSGAGLSQGLVVAGHELQHAIDWHTKHPAAKVASTERWIGPIEARAEVAASLTRTKLGLGPDAANTTQRIPLRLKAMGSLEAPELWDLSPIERAKLEDLIARYRKHYAW
jgi:hypothetical protein